MLDLPSGDNGRLVVTVDGLCGNRRYSDVARRPVMRPSATGRLAAVSAFEGGN